MGIALNGGVGDTAKNGSLSGQDMNSTSGGFKFYKLVPWWQADLYQSGKKTPGLVVAVVIRPFLTLEFQFTVHF